MTETATTSDTFSEILKKQPETALGTSAMLNRVTTIAGNTFREAVRDRVLYNLVLFVLLLIGGAIFLGELSAAQEIKIIVDLGLSSILLFGVFIAIFVGVSVVYKEIERRTVYAIFAKPVGRGEFLLGKYLGMVVTLFVNVLVMGIGVSLALLFVRRGYDPIILGIWPAMGLIFVEICVITAVSLLFSSFSSPALSALMSFVVFVIGHFSADLKTLAEKTSTLPGRIVFNGLYYLLPNFANLSFITPAAHGQAPSIVFIAANCAYALLYIFVLLAASTLIFNNPNFK
jgi:ABC-type transport system involved in multi-copper enzyme maturation permease subunit